MLEFESLINIPTPVIEIFEDFFLENNLKVFVKRDDLTHQHVSGNKFRKLKYNLLEAKKLGFDKILTFGGAYSNHIAAGAEAGSIFGFETIGIIRGDELTPNSNLTLQRASGKGMKLQFVSREEYRNKDQISQIYKKTHYIIPEGGSNILALKGVSELLEEQEYPDYICTAVGTGGTMAGLISNEGYRGKVLGVAVLKNADFLKNDVADLLGSEFPLKGDLETRFHFGGYAKYSENLLSFIRVFEEKHGIQLDQVYTAKMIWAVYEKIKEGYFEKGSKIMLLHTGGLQGRLNELFK
ncbi:MAG TPA: pyridoxal-phosphate dependent enzyme [Leadbetterella sp.]|nr:pyridoxal-phosphate dependent enzyme [Leadbetterella sp.]